MNREVLKYIKKNISSTPFLVDRLIVSSYLTSNSLSVKNNTLLINHLITKKDKEEYKKLSDFLKILGNKKLDFEDLIELFEFVVSPEEKVVTGAVYTPKYIRDYITSNSLAKVNSKDLPMICDPACGCSGFLYSSALKIKEQVDISFYEIFKNCLFGVDIEIYSIVRSKLLLSLLALRNEEDIESFEFNLHQGNSLNFDWNEYIENFNGFNYVLGNPPYVCSRNIDEESKKLLSNWTVCSTGHPDLYIPFFEIGLSILKEKGTLGFITMNSFYKSLNGKSLRAYFDKARYTFKIIDFGAYQIFGSKSTYTCICTITNTNSDSIQYKELQKNEVNLNLPIEFNEVPYSSLDSEKGWNLKGFQTLNIIESIGKPLGKLFKSRNGIATLKNKLYIFNPLKEDDKYYYLQNGSIFPIEKGICKDIINPNKLINVNSIEELKMKVIFPYRVTKSSVNLIDEKTFMKKYPKAYKYLKSKKEILATRDKGKGKYEEWYAYGRNQSLEKLKYKLFFPHITPKIPSYTISTDENLLFHNGLALIGETEKDLKYIRKLMSSRIFWFYITNSSRLYGSEYYSLSKNYFKNFGVFEFTESEKEYIVSEKNWKNLNSFIEKKYNLKLKTENPTSYIFHSSE